MSADIQENKAQTKTPLTRRSFLRGSAALAAVAGASGLAACAPTQKSDEGEDLAQTGPKFEPVELDEEIYPGTCMGYCSGGCFLNLHVRDGKLKRVSMREMEDPRFNRICPRGLTHPYRMYNPNRVLSPLRRVGERGAGEWEEISWDEAIAEITDKWKAITDECGPSGVIFACTTGSLDQVSGIPGMPMRFKMAAGMATMGADADWGAEFSVDNHFMRDEYNTTNGVADLMNAKTIIVWAASPYASQLQALHFITDARDNGTQVVVIDPIYNANASIADKYIPIKPATDGALALGMANIVVKNGWQDVDYLTNRTVAPFLVNPETHKFLRLSDLGRAEAGSEEDVPVVTDGAGNFDTPENIANPIIEGTAEANGITHTTAYSLLLERIAEWPVERASEATGIPVADIEELTRMYAQDTPTTIYAIYGADHYVNGHWNYDCLFMLGMLTGNYSKKGTSVGSIVSQTTPFLNSGWAFGIPMPEGGNMTYHTIHFADAVLTGKYNGEPFNVKGLVNWFKNPLNCHADRNKNVEALKKLDLVVTIDMMMSETAEYSDYVLPACYWFEREGFICGSTTHPYMNYQAKALEPLGDSKSDFEIAKLLGQALGLGEIVDLTSEEYIRGLLDTDMCRGWGLTYETLKEKGQFRVHDENYIYCADRPYGTPTGRAEFYLENPMPSNDDPSNYDFSKEYLPHWEEAREAGEHSPIREKYPFHLIQEHSRLRTHSQWSEVEAIMDLEGEQYVFINNQDAAELGIEDGDKVRVYNDRGSLTTYARVRPNNMPGVLSAIKGWTHHQVIDGHMANLTSLESNSFCANQPFNDCAVAIEKA